MLLEDGFPCPPVPHQFTNQLQQVRYSALFTSAPSLPDPYHFLFYMNQVLSGNCPDMVTFGLSGHGASSHAMHYYLIENNVAILLQDALPTEPGDWTSNTQQDYQAISEIVIASQDAVEKNLIASDDKLVICRSFYQPPQWGIVNSQGEKIHWNQTNDPIEDCMKWLAEKLYE